MSPVQVRPSPLLSAADPHALLDLAVRASQAAGALLVERFHGPASGVEPQELADRSRSRTPIATPRRSSPACCTTSGRATRVLGEEGAGSDRRERPRWVVDPLDGTVNFLYGIPQWAVSIACRDGRGHARRSRARSTARRDVQRRARPWLHAATAAPCGSARRPPLARALVGTGFSYVAAERQLQTALVTRVLPRARDIRRAGSAALDLAWVAAGRLDAFYEHGLTEWDHAAGDLLVREAGGVVGAAAGARRPAAGRARGRARADGRARASLLAGSVSA